MSGCDEQYEVRLAAKRYANLIATPASGQFVLPAGARFVIRPLIDALAGTLCLKIELTGIRNYHTNRNLLVGESQHIDYLQQSSKITVQTGFELFVEIGLGNYAKIAGA